MCDWIGGGVRIWIGIGGLWNLLRDNIKKDKYLNVGNPCDYAGICVTNVIQSSWYFKLQLLVVQGKDYQDTSDI